MRVRKRAVVLMTMLAAAGMRVRKRAVAAVVVLMAMFAAGGLRAQEIAGTWQGTLQADGKGLRTVLQIERGDGGKLTGTFYSVDQATEGAPLTVVTFADGQLRFTLDAVNGNYEGKLSGDGNSLTGTWTQGQKWPLDFVRATKETAWATDPSPHSVQMVEVEKDVKLEVLDWGGTGRPVILLAGLGSSAHDFDTFAPKLTPAYHVYGITRRGYGKSSVPAPGCDTYSSDRLGDDVLAVIDALKIEKPVLAGHSIGGEELSSVGTRHPERVAGLVYLDAGYGYAYFNDHAVHGDGMVDVAALRSELHDLTAPMGTKERRQRLAHLLDTSLPRVERDLGDARKSMQAMPEDGPGQPDSPQARVGAAVLNGVHVYGAVKCPVLAIFAYPHAMPPGPPGVDEATRKKMFAELEARTGEQVDAFEAANAQARVVRIAQADHFVFRSNEAEVLKEMNAFLSGLK